MLRVGYRALGIVAVGILSLSIPASAAPIFTINTSPNSSGLSFATTVFDYTTTEFPVTGDQTAILGTPDAGQGFDPNVPQIVDFGGDLPWAVSVGFGTTFADGLGTDVRVFAAQIDPTEGFDVFASADGVNFVLLGTYGGPVSQVGQLNPLALDIDFNGAPVPAGAQYLRFSGNGSSFTRGFDFDAVGVVESAATAVPEPASLTLCLLGTGLFARSRTRRVR